MRPFVFGCLCVFVLAACRTGEEFPVVPARLEHVEIGLDDRGGLLTFELPDGWRRIEEAAFRGFLYGKDGETLRVTIVLKEDRYDAAVAQARAEGGEVRDFLPGRGWPFVGVIVAYRGPSDASVLDAFIRTFRVERR